MKQTWVLAVALWFAASTLAEGIQFFWSTTGLSSPDLLYSTALTNFLPALQPSTPVTELPAGTYDLFLWGRFEEGPYFPSYTQVYGMQLQFAGSALHAQNVAYRQNKTGSGAYKRWDGSTGIALHLGMMAAVTARGIEFILPPDANNDLYYTATHEFLVGAARVTGTPGQVLDMALGPFGITGRWDNGPLDPPPGGFAHFAPVLFTPEPASWLVSLAIAGFTRRRV